uniref:Uncharacterized protein n=1 Tax=Romanomermis culicivorax TaxID=13658 RepID=A0A915JCD4_ROMCU
MKCVDRQGGIYEENADGLVMLALMRRKHIPTLKYRKGGPTQYHLTKII